MHTTYAAAATNEAIEPIVTTSVQCPQHRRRRRYLTATRFAAFAVVVKRVVAAEYALPAMVRETIGDSVGSRRVRHHGQRSPHFFTQAGQAILSVLPFSMQEGHLRGAATRNIWRSAAPQRFFVGLLFLYGAVRCHPSTQPILKRKASQREHGMGSGPCDRRRDLRRHRRFYCTNV